MTDVRYRMIAIDLDGTLLSPRGEVTERTKAAIHRALGAGLLVCFATGRNYTESRTVLDAVEHYGSAVFVGGAMVIDTAKQVTLHRMLMDPHLAADVCQVLEDHGHAAMALQDTDCAGCDYLITDGVELNNSSKMWMRLTNAKVRRVPSLGNFSHEHTVRVGMVAEVDDIDDLKRTLSDRFGQRVFMHNIHVPAQHVQVLEVFDPSVNKWEGIMHVARAHGIAAEQIVAIGDDVNDLHMISNAGLGVAMGNARDEIKSIAKRVIGTNHEEGLARFLEELVDTHAVAPMGTDAGQDDPVEQGGADAAA
jgi:5-amino-6-(5-phospho-D-ribitylamino)uracil phosphatase